MTFYCVTFTSHNNNDKFTLHIKILFNYFMEEKYINFDKKFM